jgi:hypothetical protein
MLKFRSELLLIFVFLLLNFNAAFSQRPIVNLPLKNGVYEIGAVRFEWDFEFCSQFEVQISDDSLFQQNLWVMNLNSNSLNHSFLVPGIHFFRVKCSTGDFSTPVKFEIIDLASFGNVKLHFRADSGLVIQNNKISKWINLADTTLSLVQTSDNFRPSYSPFGLTGKSAVQFGGNNTATWLNFESVFTVDSFAFFQVFQQLSTASILQYFLAGTNRGFFWGGTAGSGYNLGIFDGAAVFSNNSPQSTLPRIGCQTKNAIYGASGQLSASFIVGNQLSSMALSTLGTRPDATNLFSNGLCSEIILFDNHLNSTAAKRVIDFLKSRFSTPVNLPFDTLACAPNVVFTIPNNGSLASILWSNGSTQLQSIYSLASSKEIYTIHFN